MQQSKWATIISKYPRLAVILAVLVPQIAGSRINFYYQMAYLAPRMSPAESVAFHEVNFWLHVVIYPAAILLGILIFWQPIRLAKTPTTAQTAMLTTSEKLRILFSPLYAATFCLAMWIPGVFVFPTCLTSETGQLDTAIQNHFIGCNLVSGLAASSISLLLLCFVFARISHLHERGLRMSSPSAYYAVGLATIVAPVVPLVCALIILWQITDPAGLPEINTPYLRTLLVSLIGVSIVGLLLGSNLDRAEAN